MSVFAEALGHLRIDEAAFLRLVESAPRASLEEVQGFTSALFGAVEHQIGRPLAQTGARAAAAGGGVLAAALAAAALFWPRQAAPDKPSRENASRENVVAVAAKVAAGAQ